MRVNKQLSIRNYHLRITNSLLILSSCLCLGVYPSRSIGATPQSTPSQPTVLSPGVQGAEVQVIQVQLKALGYYNDLIDGQYGPSTQKSVAQFQQEQGLKKVDGIADESTIQHLQDVLEGKVKCNNSPNSALTVTDKPKTQIQVQPKNDNLWKLISFGVLGVVSLFFYTAQRLADSKEDVESGNSEQPLLNPSPQKRPRFFLKSAPSVPSPISTTEVLPLEHTSVVSTLNLFDRLIADLQSGDLTQQKKAIWNIAQQGDSRAVQPLVDLLTNADSQQQGLILSALAEIGTRTLKPMNRALAISMQNDNPQVRQNAIRDLVRIYDMMAQMSKILLHALDDPDPEVQATAKYALNQINRMRNFTGQITDMPNN
ncbi:peptidoglycan-binding protein [Sphaerospermopsis aphanizomenoides BCCUSP55]|uniref:peptidoglycan-binding protein n=1 Tax=Sphaerospermopsis aphanizomenoides TaxID=459663 RepID=UPI000A9723D8|nr:peptidoglycan-binding protein [Sphaerospermopsis aphanizomenoides]MBK1987564.1 peptidoglycan-binding protein [Sphaerospermopsis aphanizomenoides BCCUSP55]